jgi:hypothetical protein
MHRLPRIRGAVSPFLRGGPPGIRIVEMLSTAEESAGGERQDDDRRERADDGRDETHDEQLDRNTAEMVQELRVGAVGIQVLFAFLLVVPFNAGWKQTTSFEHVVYYLTLVCIAIATVLLIAPSLHHRLLFREHEKPYVVEVGNRLMIVGMAFVAAGMTGIFVLISDFVFGGAAAALAGGVTALVLVCVWFWIPLRHRARARAQRAEGPNG